MYQVSIGRIDNDNQNHAISEASLVSMTVRSVWICSATIMTVLWIKFVIAVVVSMATCQDSATPSPPSNSNSLNYIYLTGDFYYPNGTRIPGQHDNHAMWRNRGQKVSHLFTLITDQNWSPINGVFRCEIPYVDIPRL